jgi:hypothetical protein
MGIGINSTNGTIERNEFQFKKHLIVIFSGKYSAKLTFLTDNSGLFQTPCHHV